MLAHQIRGPKRHRQQRRHFPPNRKQPTGGRSQSAIPSDNYGGPNFPAGPRFLDLIRRIKRRSHGISVGPEPALEALSRPFSPTPPGDRIGEDVDSFNAHLYK
jgi:hypothetical protein